MSAIKLTRTERTHIARGARRHLRELDYDGGYGYQDALEYIEQRVADLGRFDDVPYIEISDYAAGLAGWVCPREAREM